MPGAPYSPGAPIVALIGQLKVTAVEQGVCLENKHKERSSARPSPVECFKSSIRLVHFHRDGSLTLSYVGSSKSGAVKGTFGELLGLMGSESCTGARVLCVTRPCGKKSYDVIVRKASFHRKTSSHDVWLVSGVAESVVNQMNSEYQRKLDLH
ncbi:hypothetical protein BgiMline_026080 [Biomphalaria glabrata]|nr:hypothetical protein BgiMline_031288 [Biomphalaria glabrata]